MFSFQRYQYMDCVHKSVTYVACLFALRVRTNTSHYQERSQVWNLQGFPTESHDQGQSTCSNFRHGQEGTALFLTEWVKDLK